METQHDLSPKAPPVLLSGSVHAEYSRCGTSGCHCARGNLHGPYYRRFWRENGRTRSRYIPLAEVPDVIAACARYAQVFPSRREVRQVTREYERYTDEILAMIEAQYKGAV